MSLMDITTGDFARRLESTTGIAFTGQLNRALDRAVRRTLARDPEADRRTLYKELHTSSDESTVDLIEALAIGETYFFRHSRQFDVIRGQVLPRLTSRQQRPLTFWSAGCSTGEEPYSLAILLESLGLLEESLVIATDLNRYSLAKAQKGIYRQNSFRQDGSERTRGFVTKVDDGWQINQEIRENVRFQQLNLVHDDYPDLGGDSGGIDLIMCRNVLMYFEESVVRRIVERFVEALSPGGFIVSGPTDPPLWNMVDLEVMTLDAGALYRKPRSPVATHPVATHPAKKRNAQKRRRRRVKPQRKRRTPNPAMALVNGSARAALTGPDDDALASARAALAAGAWSLAAGLTKGMASPEEAALHVRSLHGLNQDEGLAVAASAAERFPLEGEIHYLGATLHVCHGNIGEAIIWLRRCVYVNKKLAIAHYLLGILLFQEGNAVESRRALGRARTLCERLDPDALVELGDGVTAEQLVQAVSSHDENAAAEGV